MKEEVPQSIQLTRYLFEDKKKIVKVHLDLTQDVFQGEEFMESSVVLEKDATSFRLTLTDSKGNTYELHIKK